MVEEVLLAAMLVLISGMLADQALKDDKASGFGSIVFLAAIIIVVVLAAGFVLVFLLRLAS